MARTKGSRNKTETSVEEVQEFEYDQSEQLYQQLMTGEVIPVNPEQNEVDPPVMNPVPVYTAPVYTKTSFPVSPHVVSQLFLVEGKVRLDRVGDASIVADQRRIVNAHNVDDALEKFVNYFTSMSNGDQSYSIVQAAASETIL